VAKGPVREIQSNEGGILAGELTEATGFHFGRGEHFRQAETAALFCWERPVHYGQAHSDGFPSCRLGGQASAHRAASTGPNSSGKNQHSDCTLPTRRWEEAIGRVEEKEREKNSSLSGDRVPIGLPGALGQVAVAGRIDPGIDEGLPGVGGTGRGGPNGTGLMPFAAFRTAGPSPRRRSRRYSGFRLHRDARRDAAWKEIRIHAAIASAPRGARPLAIAIARIAAIGRIGNPGAPITLAAAGKTRAIRPPEASKQPT